MVSTLRPMVRSNILLPVLELNDSSQWLWGSLSKLALLPAMPTSMLLLVLYYHCLQTAPLNISRALFYWVCWITTDVAVRWSNCAGVRISSHKGWNIVLLAHCYHTKWSFFGIEKKFAFFIWDYKNKTSWHGAKENSYMSLIVKKSWLLDMSI